MDSGLGPLGTLCAAARYSRSVALLAAVAALFVVKEEKAADLCFVDFAERSCLLAAAAAADDDDDEGLK